MIENEKIEGGFVILPRSLMNTELWRQKPAWYFKLYMYILMRVNHSHTAGLDRGEGLFNFRWETVYGISSTDVYNFLRWAKRDDVNLLLTQKTARGVRIKVVGYELFQNVANYTFRPKMADGNDFYMSLSRRKMNEI